MKICVKHIYVYVHVCVCFFFSYIPYEVSKTLPRSDSILLQLYGICLLFVLMSNSIRQNLEMCALVCNVMLCYGSLFVCLGE